VAEEIAVPDAQVLVRYRSFAGCIGESVPVTTREVLTIGGETRAVLPNDPPRSPLPGDAPDGQCRVEPTPAGGECVGSGRHSWGWWGGGRNPLRT